MDCSAYCMSGTTGISTNYKLNVRIEIPRRDAENTLVNNLSASKNDFRAVIYASANFLLI